MTSPVPGLRLLDESRTRDGQGEDLDEDEVWSVSRARAGRPPTSAAGDEALGRPPVCAEYAARALRYRFRRLATPACVSSTTTFSNLEGRVRRSTALLRQTS
mmetsp:Transcript_8779/g.37098  ORF Transcript_8779/g.37098 Transcript_8779/m.37098 type:complete len:102 (-) Transcript_8779:69-374(-)